MTKKIRPGILCFLINLPSGLEENSGKSVTVVKHQPHSIGDGWLVRSDRPLKVGLLVNGIPVPVMRTEFHALSIHLLPIDADPDKEDNEGWFIPAPKDVACKKPQLEKAVS